MYNKIFTGTTVVFVSFSISALLAARGRWLYLGGTLMSMLNIMILFSFVNLFLRSTFIYQAHLYVGLFVICGFVIYDTQLIIEKYHIGSRDFIMHSLDLFIDFVGVFRHLLVILTQKVNCRQIYFVGLIIPSRRYLLKLPHYFSLAFKRNF